MYGFIDKTGKFVIQPRFPWTVYVLPEFEDGLAIGTAFKNADIALGFINKQGKFVVSPIYKEVGRFSEGLVAVNAGPVGFDSERWILKDPVVQRYVLLRKFLRQYDLIGLTQSEVVSLLGQPDGHLKNSNGEYYVLSEGCTDTTALIVRYEKQHVSGYNVTDAWGGPKEQWVTSTEKPLADDDLFQFCNQRSK